MDNVAVTALACGHCFCCAETCGSGHMEACPSCGGPADSKTKLYGAVASLGTLESMCSGVDAGDAHEMEQQPQGGGGGAEPLGLQKGAFDHSGSPTRLQGEVELRRRASPESSSVLDEELLNAIRSEMRRPPLELEMLDEPKEQYRCGVCAGVMDEPTSACSEGHCFCKVCLLAERGIERRNMTGNECPTCAEPTDERLVGCQPLRDLISESKMRCPHAARGECGDEGGATSEQRAATGCSWRGTVGQLVPHLQRECRWHFFSSVLLSSLELSDTTIYEP